MIHPGDGRTRSTSTASSAAPSSVGARASCASVAEDAHDGAAAAPSSSMVVVPGGQFSELRSLVRDAFAELAAAEALGPFTELPGAEAQPPPLRDAAGAPASSPPSQRRSSASEGALEPTGLGALDALAAAAAAPTRERAASAQAYVEAGVVQLFLKGLTCPQPPVQLSSLTALLSLTVHAREAEGSLAVQDAYIVGHTVETLLGMAYDRGFRLKALHLLYVLAASTPLCVQHLQEALHFTTLCAIVKIAQDQSDFLSAARCCMIFDALLQIDEGAPRATASLLSLTDLGRRRDEQRQAMQWLAAEIADNCEDEGLRAAALHTAELADGVAPPPAVLRPRLSLSSLPSLVSRVSELAADSWRRPSDTATPRRLSGGGPPRSPALAAPSPMAPADESPGAYVPPRRRGAAPAGERRARSLAEIEEEQSRHPRGGRRSL